MEQPYTLVPPAERGGEWSLTMQCGSCGKRQTRSAKLGYAEEYHVTRKSPDSVVSTAVESLLLKFVDWYSYPPRCGLCWQPGEWPV